MPLLQQAGAVTQRRQMTFHKSGRKGQLKFLAGVFRVTPVLLFSPIIQRSRTQAPGEERGNKLGLEGFKKPCGFLSMTLASLAEVSLIGG